MICSSRSTSARRQRGVTPTNHKRAGRPLERGLVLEGNADGEPRPRLRHRQLQEAPRPGRRRQTQREQQQARQQDRAGGAPGAVQVEHAHGGNEGNRQEAADQPSNSQEAQQQGRCGTAIGCGPLPARNHGWERRQAALKKTVGWGWA